MYYSTTSANYHIITRSNASRYLSQNTRIPDHIYGIATEAFQKKSIIRTIQFPKSLHRIGARAFLGCNSLQEVTLYLTGSHKSDQAHFPTKCDSLQQANIPESLDDLPQGLLLESRKLNTVHFHPDSQIRTMPKEHAGFGNANQLSSLVLPDNVTNIDDHAFYRCRSLQSISFPENLKRIGEQAFYFCNFASLELPDSLETLENSAFFKCNNLEYVQLPQNVRHIGKWVFHGCNRLKYLEMRHDPEFIGEWIINRSSTIRCYHDSKVDQYCQESGFKVEYLD